MDALKPKIKPKAPASLKQNVLAAVRKEGGDRSHSTQEEKSLNKRKLLSAGWLSAAAVLLLGIMTFALWPKEEKSVRPLAQKETADYPSTAKKESQIEGKAANPAPAPLLAESRSARIVPTRSPRKERSATTQSFQTIEEEAAGNAPATNALGQAAPSVAASSVPQTKEEEPAGEPTAGESTTSYTPYELQLLANYEKHKALVNACLAEELAQTSTAQSNLRQMRRQYIQEFIDLQQDIKAQMLEAIDEIAPQSRKVREI